LVWQVSRVVIATIMHMLIELLTDRPLIVRPNWPVDGIFNDRLFAKASGYFFAMENCETAAAELIRPVDLFELVFRKIPDWLHFRRACNLDRHNAAVDVDHLAKCACFGLYPVATL
jgi:hypothetical protein